MAERSPKVIVIDDSAVVLEVTKSALVAAGYEVITHDKPAGCVALILHEKPDLVLMDVNMPGLGGDTIVSVFAKTQTTGSTIVLLYSSLSAEVLRAKAAAAGAHGFIQKSGDLFGVVREVGRWLGRTGSGRLLTAYPLTEALRDTAPRGGVAASAPRSSSSEKRKVPTVLLVDDEMSVLSVYRRQLQAEALSVEFALSGGQALRRMLSDAPPDVVVCDMLLTDLTGVEVYQRAVALEPSYRARFAVSTGAANLPEFAAFLAVFAGPVLHKPVDEGKLLVVIRSCLAAQRALNTTSYA